MLSIGAWSAERGQDAPPHRHAGWKVTYYRTGRIDSVVDGVRYDARPATVLVLPPNAAHEEIARTAYSNYFLILDIEAEPAWPTQCLGDAAHDIGRLLAGLVREESAPDRHSPAMIGALLSTMDITLSRHHPAETLSRPASVVRSVEQIFEERYPTRLTIEAVAAEVGVSPSSLRHYFADTLGIAPQSALRRVRLRHAMTMLRTSDLPLSAIAGRCGFHSASHLSREVKADSGTSPGQLRLAPGGESGE